MIMVVIVIMIVIVAVIMILVVTMIVLTVGRHRRSKATTRGRTRLHKCTPEPTKIGAFETRPLGEQVTQPPPEILVSDIPACLRAPTDLDEFSQARTSSTVDNEEQVITHNCNSGISGHCGDQDISLFVAELEGNMTLVGVEVVSD